MSNLYYHPEDFDLKIFATIEDEPYYDFNITVILQDKQGNLFYAQDSGCSCPSPFENHKYEDLMPITIDTLDDFRREVKEHHRQEPSHFDEFYKVKHYLDETKTTIRKKG